MSSVSSAEERSPLDDYFRDNDDSVDAVSSTAPSSSIPPVHNSDEGFAERFKYFICSSGVLEKDYVPGLGAPDVEADDAGSAKAESSLEPEAEVEGVRDHLSAAYEALAERWDIAAAAAILVLALGAVLGVRWLLALLCIVAGLGYTAIRRKRLPGTQPATPPHLLNPPFRSHSTFSPRSHALAALSSLLTTSKHLDSTIETCLGVLQAQTHPDGLQPLRLALHRLTGNMTDHLAGATSTLLPMADKDELGVLGEMYDIPPAGSFLYARKRSAGSSDGDSMASPRKSTNGSVPSPRRGLTELRLQPSTSFPMSITRSLPGQSRPGHRTHVSLGGPPLPPDSLGDRFTHLPSRTPRLSKRSSWDTQTSPSLAPSPSLHLSARPRHTRRITEADEESTSSCESPSKEPRRHLTPPMTTSPSIPIQPFTPKRASPLSPRLSYSPPSRMPAITTPQTKRRSLQNMQYYPADTEERSGGANLARTRSLPHSDLQEIRSRHATGSRSRRSSLLASQVDHLRAYPQTILTSPTPPPNRIKRVVSVSPLTTPGLKASCLGIHLRRRRLACCLLGLRFKEEGKEYWEDARRAMDELMERVEAERASLDVAIGSARSAPPPPLPAAPPPPWTSSYIFERLDFAPRNKHEELLANHIREMQRTIETAWTHLQAVQQSLELAGDVASQWTDIRADLGIAVREWERGREVIKHLSPAQPEDPPTPVPSIPIDIPAFAQAWSETSESPSTSFETLPASLDTQLDDTDVLPPVGADVVFEADAAAYTRDKSVLSREDRIRLMKEARAQGLTLGDLLRAGKEEETVEDGRQVKQTGGLVVEELKGMIGMIRARKGMAEELSVGTSSHDVQSDWPRHG